MYLYGAMVVQIIWLYVWFHLIYMESHYLCLMPKQHPKHENLEEDTDQENAATFTVKQLQEVQSGHQHLHSVNETAFFV